MEESEEKKDKRKKLEEEVNEDTKPASKKDG